MAGGGTLTIDPSSIGNSGLLEANNGATLVLDSAVTNTSTGVIEALGSGSVVEVEANVSGGALNANAGLITLSGVTLDNVTLSDSGGGGFTNLNTLTIDDTVALNGATIIGGAINNSGTIVISGTSELENDATISGGHLFIDGGAKLEIESSTGATLAAAIVVNSGTIPVDPGEGGGGGSTVTLHLISGASVTGGTLTEGGSAGIVEAGAGGATLDNVQVTNGLAVTIDAMQTLVVNNGTAIIGSSVVTNDGVIEVNAGTLTVASGATFVERDPSRSLAAPRPISLARSMKMWRSMVAARLNSPRVITGR